MVRRPILALGFVAFSFPAFSQVAYTSLSPDGLVAPLTQPSPEAVQAAHEAFEQADTDATAETVAPETAGKDAAVKGAKTKGAAAKDVAAKGAGAKGKAAKAAPKDTAAKGSVAKDVVDIAAKEIAAQSQAKVEAPESASKSSRDHALPKNLDAAIARHAQANGVPERLVRRIVMIESRGNPRAAHRGNLGLMQIRLGTAKALGYTGSADGLLDAETNLTYAVRYLAGAYKVAGGNEAKAIGHYQRGYYYEAKRMKLQLRQKQEPLRLEAFATYTRQDAIPRQ